MVINANSVTTLTHPVGVLNMSNTDLKYARIAPPPHEYLVGGKRFVVLLVGQDVSAQNGLYVQTLSGNLVPMHKYGIAVKRTIAKLASCKGLQEAIEKGLLPADDMWGILIMLNRSEPSSAETIMNVAEADFLLL